MWVMLGCQIPPESISGHLLSQKHSGGGPPDPPPPREAYFTHPLFTTHKVPPPPPPQNKFLYETLQVYIQYKFKFLIFEGGCPNTSPP